ncbi:hypothetical protein [Streptomyces anulatus]|uniref:hypothetical protein n=1 Tax=Streptomyces anulatus TaxID=1892 RepID=UPI0036563FF8
MENRADDEGNDVTIYRKALTDTVHADTPTGAPEPLLALLDRLGFERQTLVTAEPVRIWHEAPGNLDEAAKKQLATAMRNQSPPAPPPAMAVVRTTDRPQGTHHR